MVLRVEKRSRKYLGTRRWGGGNIKSRRGSGTRGGVGNAGRKHKFTRMVLEEPERIKGKGFNQWKTYEMKEMSLGMIMNKLKGSKEAKPVIELQGYKVLSNGSLDLPVIVKASSFSKKAIEKITSAGGEAIKL